MLDPSHVGHPPNVPVRTSLLTTDRRRRSAPTRSTPSLERRSANHVTVKPASAEVISSLISTLSTISPPLYHRSDHLPPKSYQSTPSSPLPQNADFAIPTKPTGDVGEREPAPSTEIIFGMESTREEIPSGLKENCRLHPIQTVDATPRSNSRKRNSPKKSLQSESRQSNLKGEDRLDEDSSIGHLSIDPGPRISAISTVSSESAGRRSIRSFRSLKFKSSKEGISEETTFSGETNLVISHPNDDGAGCDGANIEKISMLARLSPFFSDQTLAKGSQAAAHENAWQPHHETDHKRISLTSGGVNGYSPGALSTPRVVPARESSLRRSYEERLSHRKQKTHRSELSGYQERTQNSPEDFSPPDQPRKIDNITEDEVTRRIKELKDQKRVRDFSGSSGIVESAGFSENTRSPSPHPTLQLLVSSPIQALRECQISEGEGNEDKGDIESSAPSPSIVQRVGRNSGSRVSSGTNKSTSVKNCPPKSPNCEPQRESAAPPKRSNSRMLKRLSRPPSPLNSERHRRTSSNPVADERPTSTKSVDKAVDSYISSSRLSQKVSHPRTGRVISFSEVGDPNGSAIFCCVGMGLTRYITAFYDELAFTLKLRLITPDRPGVGGSESYLDGSETPLGWPDDVLIICQHLKLTKFSILAHSAGAIYALATALRMPQHIRGRIHLLAPWIPPSQMTAFGTQQEALPLSALPYSQRLLRSLPTPFLRAANSSFLSTTSTSISTRLLKTPRHPKHRGNAPEPSGRTNDHSRTSYSATDYGCTEASISKEAVLLDSGRTGRRGMDPLSPHTAKRESGSIYDNLLTEAIWNAATMGANPAVDLLVCLERRQSIGFRYVDITRSVVIHHGSKDTRVPVENVKWLGKTMRRCEVRILEGEGHGLMASAAVIGGVLMEMAKEWEDWMRLVQGKSSGAKRIVRS